MALIGDRHEACVRKLIQVFQRAGKRGLLDARTPLGISEDSDFYPDVALLKRRSDADAESIPRASNALLVIEVSETTLRFDRFIKMPLYASAGALDRRSRKFARLGPPEASRRRLRRSL